jgi:Fasciclin domain
MAKVRSQSLPRNEAFADVPPSDLDAILADTELLTSVLTYHVLAGESLSAADLTEAGSLTSVQGGELRFATDEDGALTINRGPAMATCWNITTANATVHVIDRVLTRRSRGLLRQLLDADRADSDDGAPNARSGASPIDRRGRRRRTERRIRVAE